MDAPTPSRADVMAVLGEIVAQLKAIRLALTSSPEPSKPQDRAILSKRQAMKRLRVGQETLRLLIDSGQLQPIKVNGRQKIPTGQIERLNRDGFKLPGPKARTPKPQSPPAASAVELRERILALRH